jgi:hypothetical protein
MPIARHLGRIAPPCDLPADRPGLWTRRFAPGRGCPHIWSCCRWGLPCHPCHHECGALLPHLFTLTWSTQKRRAGEEVRRRSPALLSAAILFWVLLAVYFLWHFPSVHTALMLSSIVPCAVRTFLTWAIGIARARSSPLPRRVDCSRWARSDRRWAPRRSWRESSGKTQAHSERL